MNIKIKLIISIVLMISIFVSFFCFDFLKSCYLRSHRHSSSHQQRLVDCSFDAHIITRPASPDGAPLITRWHSFDACTRLDFLHSSFSFTNLGSRRRNSFAARGSEDRYLGPRCPGHRPTRQNQLQRGIHPSASEGELRGVVREVF